MIAGLHSLRTGFMIKEKLDLADGDKVEIIFVETAVPKKRTKLVRGKVFK